MANPGRALPRVLGLLLLAGAAARASAAPDQAPAPRCVLSGRIVSGRTPLPGVALSVSAPGGADLAVSSTSVEGLFGLALPEPGTYVLRAHLAGFADVDHEVVLAPEGCRATADLELVLLSRVAGHAVAAGAPAPPATSPASGGARGAGA